MNRLGRPLIIRIDVRAGHGKCFILLINILLNFTRLGAGKPTVKRIEELSDSYSFISYALGAQWHD
jgi:hypothetical protein